MSSSGQGGGSSIDAGVAFLAADEAPYITTDETIHADGGRLALNYTLPVPT